MTRKRPIKARPGAPLRRTKFQIFPPHPPDRHEALEASITQHGVERATIWDDQGNLLDGWEREVICGELGVPCPREVRHFDTEAEKFQFVLAVNAHRRPSLNQRQKRDVIAAYLKGDPGVADNMLGETLSVSKNTVLTVRRQLEASRQIRTVKRTRGKDGKLRPVKYTKRIITNSLKEFEKATEIIRDLPANCSGKTVDITTAKRRAARNKNMEERRSHRIILPLPNDAIRLYHCRFQGLENTAGLGPASANLILTDIPYDQSFLPQVAELGALAERLLVEGGLLVCMVGHFWLHKVMAALETSLNYRWINDCHWDGIGTPVHIGGWTRPHARIITKWKPILVYSKGEFTRKGQWCDVYKSSGKEKDWHPWQQPLALFEDLVRDFSEPGDLILDPCGGGLTTAEACLRLGRRCVSCDVEVECVSKGLERLERARRSLTLGA